ncbi:hypothetical protein PVL29_014552 [Vitis rotundifolia]|uniref:Ubiquitinyl hydrolase 1 n=1 Tax=Vitis rotundifolia TaxID=103349 RepID=A0AA38ZIN0_VITRO|nr:hypothetical protein PVL29_014552 [Vitis rotundifolia]
MAEALMSSPEANIQENGPTASPDTSLTRSLFHRRIEFHLARKPFSGFTNGEGGFRLETLNPTTDAKRPGHTTGAAASSGKKQDGSDHVENGLDPELGIGITFRRIGAGLENLGNTYFLNSVLQRLTYTEPLAACLQSRKLQNACEIWLVGSCCSLCFPRMQDLCQCRFPEDLVGHPSHTKKDRIFEGVFGGTLINLNTLVSVHASWSTHSSDYHCFVRTSTGMWYSLDDSQVVQVSERTVLDQKAYMFYVQKQNLVASSIAKKTCSSVSQDLNLSGADAFAAVTQNDVSNVGLPKEILSREASAPKSSRFSSDCLALTNGPMSEPSPNVALLKHWVAGLPVLNPTLEKSMPPSAPSVKGSSITNLDSAVAASTGAKFNGCSTSELHQFLNSAADKPDSEKTSPKEKIEPVKLPNGPCGENFQLEVIPKGSAAGDSLIEKADDEFLSLSSMVNGSIHMKTLDCKPPRKLKKKHVKCWMRSMHLSKWHTSDIKNLTEEHLLEAGCLSIVQGPSTFDKTQTISVGPTNPWGKRVKHGTKKGDKRTAVKDVEFKDRIGQEGAKLATDKEPQKSSIARWDDIEWPSTQVMESRSVEGATTGHVPDEWDEEYDRGKRKKVSDIKK